MNLKKFPRLQFVIMDQISLLSPLNSNDRSIPLSITKTAMLVEYCREIIFGTLGKYINTSGFRPRYWPVHWCSVCSRVFRLNTQNGTLRAPLPLILPSRAGRDLTRTDKKNRKFSPYKEIQKGSDARSCMTNGLLISG
jgi:hypothetical protein